MYAQFQTNIPQHYQRRYKLESSLEIDESQDFEHPHTTQNKHKPLISKQ